jgi:hypothetical protein
MGISDYPGALDTFSTKTNGPGNPVLAEHTNKLQSAVVALETALKRPNVIVVAASNASAAVKVKAHRVCSGSGDQATINAALNDLPTFDTFKSGTVVLTEGQYNLSGSITPNSHQMIVGSGFGTKVRLSGGANVYAFDFVSDGGVAHSRGIYLAHMTIECNGGAQAATSGAVRMAGGNRCILSDLFITEPRNAGIRMEVDGVGAWPWANVIMGVTVVLGRNSVIASTAGFGMDLGDGEENLITGCNFEFNGESHIVENVVGNNAIIGNSFVGGRSAASTNGIKSNGSRGRWIGNIFDGVPGHTFRITGNENILDGNASFNIGDGNAGQADGVALAFGASRNIITNNRFSSHGTDAVTRYLINDVLDGAGNTHFNLIAHNVLKKEGGLSGAGGVLVNTYQGDNIYRDNVGYVGNSEVHDVTRYGARNDQNDATGTRAAVQAAIDACPVGGTVYFPPGIFRMEGTPWQIRKRIRIIGAGFDNTTIEAGTNHNNDIFFFDVSAGTGSNGIISGGYMGGFKIDHRPADQAAMTTGTGRLIAAIGAVHWTFENIHFSRPYHIGLHLRGIPSGEFGHHNKVRGCLFDGGSQSGGNGQGLRLEGSDENYITDCDFENNGGGTGNPEDKGDVKDWSGLNFFDSCCFVGGGQNQRHYTLQDANGSRLQGCIFDGSGEADMVRIQGGRVSITGCDFTSISAGATTTNTYSAVVLATGAFSTITGCTFATDENTANNAKCRSFVREITGAHHNAVVGNTFKHNTNSGTNATLGTGATETSGTGTVVANNVV